MLQGTEAAQDVEPVGKHEALAELERLLSDPIFHASERNRNFLRYVVMEYLEGRGDSIKAYTIAVDVFGRPESFDALTDPVVRIEATRLRTALTHCYEVHPSCVRIEIPRGRYVPRFVRMDLPIQNAIPPPEASSSGEHSAGGHSSPHFGRNGPTWIRWAGSASAIVVVLAGLVFYQVWSQRASFARFSEKPIVSLVIEGAQNWRGEDGSKIGDELLVALSRFQTIRLAGAAGLRKAANVEATRAITQGSRAYTVVLRLDAVAEKYVIEWRILSSANEVLQTSGQYLIARSDASSAELRALVSRLSRDLAGYRGAIPVMETRLELDNPTLGNGCVQRSLVALGERLDEEIRRGRQCLERTLAAQPGNADARAALSLLILVSKPFETTSQEKARALELARTAVSLAPNSQRSAFALMVALYHAREVDAAITAGYRAMSLNPNDYGSRVYLGWVLFASGRWDEGVRLVEESRGKSPLARNFDSGSTLLLNAYRRGNYDDVITMLNERPYQRPYMAMIIHAATLGQLGQEQQAAVVVEALRKLRPEFDRSFQEDMAARSLSPELTNALKSGLIKAELQIQ